MVLEAAQFTSVVKAKSVPASFARACLRAIP